MACPTVFWPTRQANFVGLWVENTSYRSESFFRPHEQWAAGPLEYAMLKRCVVALLTVQTDHEREGGFSGSSRPTFAITAGKLRLTQWCSLPRSEKR
jgi:hypothetical protein